MFIRKNAKYILTLFVFLSIAVNLLSCENTEKVKIDISIFNETTPINIENKKISVSDYEGGQTYIQSYTLYLYQDEINFTDCYPEANFSKKIFEIKDNYENFGLVKTYKQYLYFHVMDNNMVNHILRYDMENDKEEIIFTYENENQIEIVAINDRYLIWKEDENANWLKVSLNCYDFKSGRNEKFFTYSRNEETDLMYSWNFNEVIIDGDCVYFDNTENIENDIANVNLYEYNITNNSIKLIAEKRAAQPMQYKGISWLGYDNDINEYIIKNKDSNKTIALGSEYFRLYSSKNIVVGCRNSEKDGILYFDGKNSYPIIESTRNIDQIYCSDHFITWDGWSNDIPKFFDINKQKIVNVNCLEPGRRYAGYVNDNYMIFEAHDFIPDQTVAEGAITTKSLIYYFIKVVELH